MIKKPPPPPLNSLIIEGTEGSCPKCGSTMRRKYIIIGRKICIHPDCRED